MAMAASFAMAVGWTLAPKPSQPAPRIADANSGGRMLIPSHVPDKGPKIDHAIGRQAGDRTVKQSTEKAAPGAALDAIYRISPKQAARDRHRIMM
jgi:hypothetical protein